MAEKPILFNTPMVQAILDLRKRMTRRPIDRDISNCFGIDTDGSVYAYINPATGDSYKPEDVCRYKVGDILYVRETWCNVEPYTAQHIGKYIYKATWVDNGDPTLRWKPSIHMPREAARIFLRVTWVRVERLQEITGEQAIAEGFEPVRCDCSSRGAWGCTDCMNTGVLEPAMLGFVDTWNDIYAKRGYGWEQNSWVEVTEFERVEV